MQDAQMDQAELELKRQELVLDARKDGVKMAAERRKNNAKADLDMIKTMKDSTPRDQ
jgi:hypothetical protein